jgi:hypothetical protein
MIEVFIQKVSFAFDNDSCETVLTRSTGGVIKRDQKYRGYNKETIKFYGIFFCACYKTETWQ